MKRTKITPDITLFPAELCPLMLGADVYDSSCSPEARVWFIDRDGGLFLKRSAVGSLMREAELCEYFYKKGLGAPVLTYMRDTAGGFDWLLTKRIAGEDATHSLYLSDPRRLAVTSGEILRHLHSLDGSDCPVTDRMITYFATVDENHRLGQYDGSYGSFKDADEAYAVTLSGRGTLKSDTLLHGDYCLPNFLLDGWRFSGFIDLGGGGVGDRHVDLFWGAWTLNFNLKTDKYREIFFDAYGRELVDPEKLRIISAAECFG